MASLSSSLTLTTFSQAVLYPAVGFVLSSLTNASPILSQDIPSLTTAEAGNPFVEGWYADPDTAVYDGLYWVYPTTSAAYEEQTYFDAFSSPDLIHWTKHPNILNIANISWATKALWAPASVARNNKYYLYFSANDLQEDEDAAGMIGGIGVAVADRPEGPYVDAIGKPLIGNYHYGAQPIDQDVFVDPADGQAYIYYGGHSHANVAKLNEDMVSVGFFDDGTQFSEITPMNYVEGAQMIKRGNAYYLMWSEGGWTGPDYSVSYAKSSSPIGPFNREAKILEQDSEVARGSGHNGVFNVPGTDTWYIVYHRRPLSENDGNHRVLAYDRMYFSDNATIEPVRMLVKDNFADGNMIGWETWLGSWKIREQKLAIADSQEARATLDTNFADLVYDANIIVGTDLGDAGLIFRATELDIGTAKLQGYYASFSATGVVTLEKADGSGEWKLLSKSTTEIILGVEYDVRVEAIGNEIKVFIGDSTEPRIIALDDTYKTGTTGLGVRSCSALFGSISVARPALENNNE
ncbi:glycoside hydrolase family 43 protein [Hypomontagnella submonticulosa]|nr:glycoside hydrolase family 43 protein [Hypomontagnella submonticulosa]